MTVAIVGGAAIGLAGTVYASNRASSAAKKAGKRQTAAEDKRMAFEQEQLDDWNNTYGNVEDQLAEYYETLSPTLRTVQGLEAFEKEKDIALKSMRETLDQRGIGTSGIAGQVEADVELGSAQERARIRADAPMEVAKEKAGFLSVGLGKKPGGVGDAYRDQQISATNISNIAARNAGAASGAVATSVADLAGAGLDKAADWYANREPSNPTQKGAPI